MHSHSESNPLKSVWPATWPQSSGPKTRPEETKEKLKVSRIDLQFARTALQFHLDRVQQKYDQRSRTVIIVDELK